MSNKRLLVIRFPAPEQKYPLINLLTILNNFVGKISVISGYLIKDEVSSLPKITFKNIKVPKESPKLGLKLKRYFIIKSRILKEVVKKRKTFETLIIFQNFEAFIEVIFLAKILKKEIIIVTGGSSYQSMFHSKHIKFSSFFAILTRILELIVCTLANKITVYTESMIKYQKLEKFQEKIFTNGARYVDTNRFFLKNYEEKRQYSIGYVGRLEYEKGFHIFVKLVREANRNLNNQAFLIVGNGSLAEYATNLSKQYSNVTYLKWVDHNEIPNVLNNIQVIVIPSLTEGFPSIIIEAVLCGAIVLTSDVGGIADFIVDNEVGFIINSYIPNKLLQKIDFIFTTPNKKLIQKQSIEKAKDWFGFENAVKRWEKIIS